jgi:hypothetical protein
MIKRPRFLKLLSDSLLRSPVTALLGPRQCGKTTLARSIVAARDDAVLLDLEDPAVLESLQSPKTVLSPLRGLIVLDEIQRRPDLFPLLRVLVDRIPLPAKFLVLGSASPDMLRQTSESLAGRVEFVEMAGFDLTEVGPQAVEDLWVRGGFPRSYLAGSAEDSILWREDFLRTFLERDLRAMGVDVPALVLRRFFTMVAHYHGQTWNGAEVAGSLGINDVTARRYLDLLAGSYMVRLLPPWFENVGKRQRRAPRIYLRDTGILHSILGLGDRTSLLGHPKCGASWEGLALEQVLCLLPRAEAYYWAVHSGPELDLLLVHRGRRVGVEFKFADAPTLSRQLRTAFADLKLESLWIVYPGERRYALKERVEALPLVEVPLVLPELLTSRRP